MGDMEDVRGVFTIIEGDATNFNSDAIYTFGFSQNSMFSAYVGFCLSDKVKGIVQGGSGLVVKKEEHSPPPNQGAYCTHSSFNENGGSCKTKDACDTCEYWPIYPCYAPNPIVHCSFIYECDYMGHTQAPMYERAKHEGFEVRMFEFSLGSHLDVQNKEEWFAGCLGITTQCSSDCEATFNDCIDPKIAAEEKSSSAYSQCVKELTGDCATCSPTLAMVSKSETPKRMHQYPENSFGAATVDTKSKPADSCCEWGVEPDGTACAFETTITDVQNMDAGCPTPSPKAPADGTPADEANEEDTSEPKAESNETDSDLMADDHAYLFGASKIALTFAISQLML